MIPGPEIDDLISDHVDGCLDDQRHEQLERWLTSDPAHRHYFLTRILEHQALQQHAAKATAAARASIARMRRQRRIRKTWYYLPLAAAAVLAMSWWWLSSVTQSALNGNNAIVTSPPVPIYPPKSIEARPQVIEAHGCNVVVGTWVEPETAVITGRDGHLTLRWADGSTVEVAADSRMVVSAGMQMRLDVGRISAVIAPQDLLRPARFRTPEAEVTVVGTRLTIASQDGESLAEVEHGQIRVQRSADHDEILLTAGQCTTITSGTALRSRALGAPAGRVIAIAPGMPLPTADALAPGDIVDLAAGVHPGAWRWLASGTALRPIVLRGAGAGRTVLDATASSTTGDHNGPRAVLQIEGRHLVIAGVSITGAHNGTFNGAGIRVRDQADDVSISNCHITACDQGITADLDAGNFRIEQCDIVGNGSARSTTGTRNLALGGRGSDIRSCRIADARGGTNIQVQNGTHRLIATRISGGADGEIHIVPHGDDPCEVTMLGTLIVGIMREPDWNERRFVSVDRSITPRSKVRVHLDHCTLVAGDSRNVIFDAPGVTIDMTGCVVSGTTQILGADTSITGRDNWLPVPIANLPGSIFGEPMFKDLARGDYRLVPGSTLRVASIPAGVQREPPGIQSEGRARSNWQDPGAFETLLHSTPK
ncbi:MAG: FecR domain-containing protein [Planctomycetota bacterium]